MFQAGLVPYHSKCVFDSNRAMLLPSNMEGKSPANLFGFLLPYGYCPVVCDTVLSANIASGVDKLDLPGVRMAIIEQATLNWAESTHIMDSFSTSDEIAEVGTLFEAGLVPWSMAGDLGEEERKSACKHGIFTFTLDDPLQSSVPNEFAEESDGWETFFGVPGYTKVSHTCFLSPAEARPGENLRPKIILLWTALRP